MNKRLAITTTLIAAIAVLGGCQGTDRPLSYDKGVYGGKKDQKLTAEQVDGLRQRGTLQN